MAIIKNTTTNAGKGCVCEGEKSSTLLVGMYISATTMESSTEVPQKTEIDLPCDPVTPLCHIRKGM
jgi:hypothetical protein